MDDRIPIHELKNADEGSIFEMEKGSDDEDEKGPLESRKEQLS